MRLKYARQGVKNYLIFTNVEFRQEPPHAVVVHSWPVFFTTTNPNPK